MREFTGENLNPVSNFFMSTPENCNLENLIFSGLSRVSGSGQQKWTSDLDSTGQNT